MSNKETQSPETLLRRQNREYQKAISQQQFKIAELEALTKYLQLELNKQRGLRRQSKDLYKTVDQKIMLALDKRGYQRKTRKNAQSFPAVDLAKLERKNLMQIAWTYDAQSYFRYYPQRENMKFRYRLASKVYRTARDTSVLAARKSYQLARRSK
jgi:hypothetical protein